VLFFDFGVNIFNFFDELILELMRWQLVQRLALTLIRGEKKALESTERAVLFLPTSRVVSIAAREAQIDATVTVTATATVVVVVERAALRRVVQTVVFYSNEIFDEMRLIELIF
jgi:hypothetical protein